MFSSLHLWKWVKVEPNKNKRGLIKTVYETDVKISSSTLCKNPSLLYLTEDLGAFSLNKDSLTLGDTKFNGKKRNVMWKIVELSENSHTECEISIPLPHSVTRTLRARLMIWGWELEDSFLEKLINQRGETLRYW